MTDPYAHTPERAPVSLAGKHDRHACPIYKRTIAPCKDCLPSHHDDHAPVPMCSEPVVRRDNKPESQKVTRRVARKKDVEISPGVHQTNVGHVPESLKFGDPAVRREFLENIFTERERHRAIGFAVNHSPLEWLRIMTEELGEIAKAMAIANVTDRHEEVVLETVQLAAAAVAMLESMHIQQHNKMLTLDLPEDP